MAFDPDNAHIAETLRSSNEHAETLQTPKATEHVKPLAVDTSHLQASTQASERTQQYTFSLRPSVRQKLADQAHTYGYSSVSGFLTALINQL